MFVIAQVCEDLLTSGDAVHYWHGGHVWGTDIQDAAQFATRGDVEGTVYVIRCAGDPIPTAYAAEIPSTLHDRVAARANS